MEKSTTGTGWRLSRGCVTFNIDDLMNLCRTYGNLFTVNTPIEAQEIVSEPFDRCTPYCLVDTACLKLPDESARPRHSGTQAPRHPGSDQRFLLDFVASNPLFPTFFFPELFSHG